jgi:two-component system, NarL family, sensor histidine kinase UhpB
MGVVGPMRLGALGTRRLIDGVTLGLAAAAFWRLGDSEILLLALWVIIGVGAFVYGFRAAVLRIVFIAVASVVYVQVTSSLALPVDPELVEQPDPIEWPLMMGIGIIVSFLADRIATSAGRYALLYREASERLLTAQEQERGRLARDLHDGVGQTLTAVLLTLHSAEVELGDGSRPPSAVARSSIVHAQALAAGALAETRDVAAQLRPARIHEIGLGAALLNLARDAGVEVEVRFDPAILPAGTLELEREVDAFRIVQEAIGNAARHSRARQIWIDGEVSDHEIRLEVGDDGRGLDSSARVRG